MSLLVQSSSLCSFLTLSPPAVCSDVLHSLAVSPCLPIHPSLRYQNLETFIIDVNLVFDNCEKFNEDNSDIGRAGHNMRKFFEKRWTELLKQTN